MKEYTVGDYAAKIKKSRQWVHILILKNKVKFKKIGTQYIIIEK